jgi:hypothetical protein
VEKNNGFLTVRSSKPNPCDIPSIDMMEHSEIVAEGGEKALREIAELILNRFPDGRALCGPILGVVYDPLRAELFAATAGRGASLNDAPLLSLGATRLDEAIVALSFGASEESIAYMSRVLPTLTKCVRKVRTLGTQHWTSPMWRQVGLARLYRWAPTFGISRGRQSWCARQEGLSR